MQIKINEIPVCLINLPERKERLERSIKEFEKFYSYPIYGFDYHIIPGVMDKISHIGIATAHMNCIQLAKDKNWPFVVICEDDLQFQSIRSKEYALEAFKVIPDDFDILLSGIYTSAGLKPYNEYWNRTGEFSGLHYYVVAQKAYDTILAFNKSMHIDRWMARQKLNCYVANEFFCIQYEGYSDNVRQNTSYGHLLKKFKVLK